MKLNILAVLIVAGATSSLMSMDMHSELVTKTKFIIENDGYIKECVMFAKKNKVSADYVGRNIIDVACLKELNQAEFFAGRYRAETEKKTIKLFLTSVNKDSKKKYITKISPIIVTRKYLVGLNDEHFLVTMKPW